MRPMLGTFVSIGFLSADTNFAEDAIEAAFASVATVDRLMHPTRAGSDLVAIREAAPGERVCVHPWTWRVLELSQHLNNISDGLFDPCVPTAVGRISDVELPEAGVVICRRSVAIDLGGIAKGFAVDQAIAALMAAGCDAGEVNAGGDVRVFGMEPESIWVRVRARAWPITLQDQACAVSDPASAAQPTEHRGYYHRTDAETARWVSPRGVAVVLAPTAAVADALTKIVLLNRECAEEHDMKSILAALGAHSLTSVQTSPNERLRDSDLD